MATTKITVTLPNEQLQEIRDLVESGKTANVSAFIQHAVRIALQDVAGWREMLDQALQQTGGPLTDEERAWADEILESKPKKTHRKGKAA